MEPAEAGGEGEVSQGGRGDERDNAECKVAEAHGRNDADGERSAGDDGDAIEHEPCGGDGVEQAGVKERPGEQRASENGRGEAEDKFAARLIPDGGARSHGLVDHGEGPNGDGEDEFSKPDGEPAERSVLAGGQPSGRERGGAHNHSSQAWDGGEGSGPLHGGANVFEVFESMIRHPDRFYLSHEIN